MFIVIFAIVWILKDNLHHFPLLVFDIALVLALIELAFYVVLGILCVIGLIKAKSIVRKKIQ